GIPRAAAGTAIASRAGRTAVGRLRLRLRRRVEVLVPAATLELERGSRDQPLERVRAARLALGLVRIAHPLLVLELTVTGFALVLVDRHLKLLVAEAHDAHG